MNLLKIKKKTELIGLSLKDLCEKIDMSYQNLNRCIRENKISANDLEKIAGILQVPVSYFFEDDNKEVSKKINAGDNNVISIGNKNNNNTNANTETKDLAVCRKEVEGLKKEIELLKEMNEMLKERK